MSDPRLSGKVAEALERASSKAIHGSPAARRGALDYKAEYARSLLSAAQRATDSWANWEVINETFEKEPDVVRALKWQQLGAIGPIRMALARDAILGAYRLSDDFDEGDARHRDRVSLCRIAMWLDDPATKNDLGSEQWALDLGYRPELVANACEYNRQLIERLTSAGNANPQREQRWRAAGELAKLRDKFKPLRNQLAHCLDGDIVAPPRVAEFHQMISVTLDLATDAAFLWCGSAVTSHQYRTFAHEQAQNFWQLAFQTPIDHMRRDHEQRRDLGLEIVE